MIEKLKLIRRVAHDSMWYSSEGRKEAYAAILDLIKECEKEPEKVEEGSQTEVSAPQITFKRRGRPPINLTAPEKEK